MKTYYIVKSYDSRMEPKWCAYYSGIRSTLNKFDYMNALSKSISDVSADDCEERLNNILKAKKIKPQIIRAVTI